tara:strand:+ start:1218 stop:1526 length:309 start_codon:yes stop_codon:yes gene_type:complete
MNPLRKEIEDELQRTRLDKTRLYQLLIKMIDAPSGGGSGGVGPAGPPGPTGPHGPAGPQGPVGASATPVQAKAAPTPAPAPTPAATPSKVAPKKVVAPKKKA